MSKIKTEIMKKIDGIYIAVAEYETLLHLNDIDVFILDGTEHFNFRGEYNLEENIYRVFIREAD